MVGLAAVPFLLRGLGTEPYGIIGIIAVLAGQLGALHLGVAPAATRLIAQGRGSGDPRAVGDAIVGSMVVGAIAALAVGGVFAVIAPPAWRAGFTLSEGALALALSAVPAAAVQVGLTPANAAMYGLLYGRELFVPRTILYGLQGTVRLLSATAVVASGGGVVGVLWAFAITDAVTLIAGLTVALKGVPLGRARLGQAIRPVLAIGLPFALGSIPAALLVDVEKLVLGMRASVEAFAYYSVPYNGVIRLSLIGAAVGTVLLPRVTAEMAKGATDQAARLTRSATRLLAVTMLVVLVPMIAVTPELLRLWIDADFASRSSLAARLLMVAVFANVAARPPLAVIQGRAHPLTLAWVYAGELALHFPLTLFLVDLWGITGAALAWSLRAVLDNAVLRALAARTLGQGVGEGGVVWLATAALAALVAALTLTSVPVGARLLGAALLAGAAFFALLDRAQRTALIDSLALRAAPGAAPVRPSVPDHVGVPDPDEPEATL